MKAAPGDRCNGLPGVAGQRADDVGDLPGLHCGGDPRAAVRQPGYRGHPGQHLVAHVVGKQCPQQGDAGGDPDLAEGGVDARGHAGLLRQHTPTAVEASGGFTRPTPRPLTIIPGMRWVQDELALSPRMSSRPTPTMSRPGPISSRAGTREESLPATVAVARIAPDRNITRTPVASGE